MIAPHEALYSGDVFLEGERNIALKMASTGGGSDLETEDCVFDTSGVGETDVKPSDIVVGVVVNRKDETAVADGRHIGWW